MRLEDTAEELLLERDSFFILATISNPLTREFKVFTGNR